MKQKERLKDICAILDEWNRRKIKDRDALLKLFELNKSMILTKDSRRCPCGEPLIPHQLHFCSIKCSIDSRKVDKKKPKIKGKCEVCDTSTTKKYCSQDCEKIADKLNTKNSKEVKK